MADQPSPNPCACGAADIPSVNIEVCGKDQPDRYYVVCLVCHQSNRVDSTRQRPPGFATRPEAIADWNASPQSKA